MNEELKKRIKLLKRRADAYLICLVTFLSLLPLGCLVTYDDILRNFGIILLVIATIGICIFVCLIVAYKKDANTYDAKPCVLCEHSGIKYEDLLKRFESLSAKGNRLCLSENLQFFRFKKKQLYTTVVYKTDSFSKSEFDRAKKRINKKANKEFNIPHKIAQYEDEKCFRLNIICLDSMNDEANFLLSLNAEHNLRRTEALMNIAVVGDKIIIPPIYGDCYQSVFKYKKIVNFIMQNILEQ